MKRLGLLIALSSLVFAACAPAAAPAPTQAPAAPAQPAAQPTFASGPTEAPAAAAPQPTQAYIPPAPAAPAPTLAPLATGLPNLKPPPSGGVMNPPTVIPTTAGSNAVTSGQTTPNIFRDPALGLTFQYPADWRKTTGPVAVNPRAQRIELARPSQPAGHNAEILIDVRPKSGDALLTWVKQRLPTGSLMLSSDYLESSFKNLKDYNARLNGLPAIFVYQPEHGSGTPNMAALFVADKQSVYQFTYHGDIPDDSVNRVAYLRLLNTVTLSGTTRSGITLPASAFTAGIDLTTFK